MSIVQLDEYMRKVSGRRPIRRGLAVGDSWFQYPLRSYGDIQRKLASRFHRQVAFYDDSTPGRDARTLPRTVLPRLRRIAGYLQEEGKPFEIILASFGGNDVIGCDFVKHIRRAHTTAKTPIWRWSDQVPDVALRHIRFDALSKTFDEIQAAYEGLIALRDEHAPGATIVGHTYADVTPADAAYRFAFMVSGPWLWDPMRAVGLEDGKDQRELSRWLLSSFSALLKDYAKPGKQFVLLDTRTELSDYDSWWDNEIHPNNRGYNLLVDKYWAPAVEQALRL